MSFYVFRLGIYTNIWLFVSIFKIDFFFLNVWDGNIIGLYCVIHVIEL